MPKKIVPGATCANYMIKFILALLIIFSICSCVKNKSVIQPSISVDEKPLEAQNNITEINDNITNSYLSIFFQKRIQIQG
jgi:predicted small secreted protein